MTDAPDLQQLARRYLDLWQDQVGALVNDPTTAEAMAKAYTLLTRGGAAFAQAVGWPPITPASGAPQSNAHCPPPGPQAAGAAPGTTAVVVPPVEPGDGAVHLATRIAELEERIGRLEAALADKGRGAAGGGRRRRP